MAFPEHVCMCVYVYVGKRQKILEGSVDTVTTSSCYYKPATVTGNGRAKITLGVKGQPFFKMSYNADDIFVLASFHYEINPVYSSIIASYIMTHIKHNPCTSQPT